MALLTHPSENPPPSPLSERGDGGISQRTVLMRVYQCCVVRLSSHPWSRAIPREAWKRDDTTPSWVMNKLGARRHICEHTARKCHAQTPDSKAPAKSVPKVRQIEMIDIQGNTVPSLFPHVGISIHALYTSVYGKRSREATGSPGRRSVAPRLSMRRNPVPS